MTHRQTGTAILILTCVMAGGLGAWWYLSRQAGQRTGGSSDPLPVLATVPEFALTDQDGHTVGLKDLLGKAWVANFIFTRCAATCPAQSKNLADFQAKLADSPLRDKVRIVSVSVDPEFDTPKVLKAYAEKFAAKPAVWSFLTGSADDVLSLSQEGFLLAAGRQEKGAAGPMHSAKFALVDAFGQIRGYYDGVSAQVGEDLLRDFGRVIPETAPSAPPIAESAALRDPTQKLDDVLKDTSWLTTRRKEQVETAKSWTVFHDFGFSDRRYESGITFRHRIVDDAANVYKAVHYDHGNGLVAADVDGDGRTDLYFVNQVGACQLWRNLGGGKFEDVTEKAGVALPDPIKCTASFVDVNNDGFPDLYVTTVRGGNHLFLNDGKGHFTDVTEKSGLGVSGHYSAAVYFDYDRDGLVDLFLCEVGKYSSDTLRTVSAPVGGSPDGKSYQYYEGFADAFSGHLKPERTGKCRLFRNLGEARFKDVTADVGLDTTRWTGDATAFDANGDGWPDLYVLSMQGENEYFENRGGKTFVKKSREVFPKAPWGAMGVKVFDFNNDGQFDLFVTDMHSDMSKVVPPTLPEEKRKSRIAWPPDFLATTGTSIFGNALFEGQGGGKYLDVSDTANAETFWPWGPSVADLNADGYQDVFVTAGMSYPFRYGINSVLLNDGGKRFVDAEFVLGVEPRRGGRTSMPWFEQPADPGKPGSRPVTIWSSLSSRSSVVFDLDGDGDLDIVTSEFNTVPMVLVSNLSERKKVHVLTVKLEGGMTPEGKQSDGPGSKSNRDGLGAIIRVKSGGRNQFQLNDGKSGYLSQSSVPLYFGLGGSDTVDEIEVVWPTGKKQIVPGPIRANTPVTIREQ